MSENLSTMRHSAAHLLAAAVKNLFPKTSLGIGPVIEDGFYYDFDSTHKFSTDDFKKIEKEIERLKNQKIPFDKIEISTKEALKLAKKISEPYKIELIKELEEAGEEKVSFYKTGQFIDLCTGPHVDHSGQVGEVKLTSIAGAYWKGNENNKMLQRIYGTAWETKKQLEEFLKRLEEAKKRDHKKLGVQLQLFTFSPLSPGMPYWYPNGLTLINNLKGFIREVNKKYGYKEISTPILAKKDVWETSGHWKLFRNDMFTFEIEKQTYALKPMNCPQTLVLYNSTQHSYRDLPIKLSDLDLLHRNEASGTLNGLFRVRELSQDDAHVLCSQEQIEMEVSELLDIALHIYETFGFTPRFYLATRPEKALGDKKLWDKAEKSLKGILEKKKVQFDFKVGEGSFYGPKIDLHIQDSLKRDWQLATIQLDPQMPKRFGAVYTDTDGKEKTPVMIHRAILGSFERFLAILIEHFGGKFPLWLSPIQVAIIPIAQRHNPYAQKINNLLAESDIKVQVDERAETMQAKIRDAQLQKIPYMLIVGDKEQVQNKVSIRSLDKGDQGQKDPKDFLDSLKKEIESKRM